LTSSSRAEPALAYHYWKPPLHIGFMHSSASSRNEEFCVYTDASIAQSTAYSRIAGALWVDGWRTWDGLASNKVWVVPYLDPCPSLTNRANMEIEYEVRR